MITVGQITADSKLGKFLTEQAGNAEVIVEIGTGSGLGSTRCIAEGMGKNGKAVLFSYEACHEQIREAGRNIFPLLTTGNRIILRYGVLHRNILPYSHPFDSQQIREMWEQEKLLSRITAVAEVPSGRIDMLLLDGGEYTSRGDWEVLKDQASMVVLDDCNAEKAVKNAATYAELKNDPNWWCVAEDLQDRNGWAAFKRR